MPTRRSLTDPWNGQFRQIHLDFHNSPFIADLAADFDAAALARRFKAAHVNSVIVFSKCVHGMGYYPSKIVQPHPALKGRDLMGEMIEALHAEGIRAPIYTIIGWEENLAQQRPEWMQMCDDGSFAQNACASDGFSQEPGRYRWLNFIHPDYQDYYEAHLDEVLKNYPCDGFFLDMLVVHPKADWSDQAIVFREKHGLLGRDALTHYRYETAVQTAFTKRFTKQIRARAPHVSIFYNAENRLFTRADLGVICRAADQTHAEIESLPSGMWNYAHFPRAARNLRARGPFLGMTGRFQKMWGDFGAVKPVPALEFECFRTQALGGANSVGDQLHPRGTLDEGAYHLIGPALHGHGLKSTVRLYPMRSGRDLKLTLLHYLPERRAINADIISEKLGFGGQILRLPSFVNKVEVWSGGEQLERVAPDGFALPICEGRLLLNIPKFFRSEAKARG